MRSWGPSGSPISVPVSGALDHNPDRDDHWPARLKQGSPFYWGFAIRAHPPLLTRDKEEE